MKGKPDIASVTKLESTGFKAKIIREVLHSSTPLKGEETSTRSFFCSIQEENSLGEAQSFVLFAACMD